MEAQRQSVENQAAEVLADARVRAARALADAAEWLQQVVEEAERVRTEARREAEATLRGAREDAARIVTEARTAARGRAVSPGESQPVGAPLQNDAQSEPGLTSSSPRPGDERRSHGNRNRREDAAQRQLDQDGVPRRWWWVRSP